MKPWACYLCTIIPDCALSAANLVLVPSVRLVEFPALPLTGAEYVRLRYGWADRDTGMGLPRAGVTENVPHPHPTEGQHHARLSSTVSLQH